VRESLKGQDLSFTEIAKIVGERWQVLPANEREACERQASGGKEKYYAELAEYKKTKNFAEYQKYLEDFRAKYSVPTKGLFFACVTPDRKVLIWTEGKRSKLDAETSTTTRAGSNEHVDRSVNRRLSSAQPDVHKVSQHKPDPNQPISLSRLSTGGSYASKPTSPANYPMSGFNSPRSGEQFPTTSASAASSATVREGYYEPSAANLIRGPGVPFDANPYFHPMFTTTSSYTYPANHQAPIEHSSRRPVRESTLLPPLSHEDTTLSSEGSSNNGPVHALTVYPAHSLPIDQTKTMRMLPQPVPNIGPSTSPLDWPVALVPAPHQAHDHRLQGPLAALIKAGELASRVADGEMETEGSP
jgi:hypothetical protein